MLKIYRFLIKQNNRNKSGFCNLFVIIIENILLTIIQITEMCNENIRYKLCLG